MTDILNITVLGNRLFDYGLSIGIFIGSLIVLQAFRRVLLARLRAWSAQSPIKIYDFIVQVIQRQIVPLLYFFAIYISVQGLTLSPFLQRFFYAVGMVLLTVIILRFLGYLINFLLLTFWIKGTHHEAQERSLKTMVNAIKILLWGAGVMFLLDNLGFKVSTVIAGLGIGGVAVALAAQAILGDLFSFLAIMIDRPFEPGDFIIVGDFRGTVEQIGVKTTRIRSLGGEQLVFANTDLTNSRVRNYKRMERRRILFTVRVIYQTPPPQLREIPGIIKQLITRIKKAEFDRAHFAAFGDFSLDVEVVYYVLAADYNVYRDVQEQINLAIMEEFAKRGIEFAYPTQSVYVTNTKAPSPAGTAGAESSL